MVFSGRSDIRVHPHERLFWAQDVSTLTAEASRLLVHAAGARARVDTVGILIPTIPSLCLQRLRSRILSLDFLLLPASLAAGHARSGPQGF
jgi:hypothetical protein